MKTYMKQQKNRRLLFGYCIVDGMIAIHEKEAEIVELIFEKYLSGYSYQRLALLLENGSVQYRADACRWNKNMVQRILSREEYCGLQGYPAIIDRAIYEIVQGMRNRKAEYLSIKLEWPKAFREKLYCYHCGSRLVRKHPGNTVNWQCQTEGRTTNGFVTDELLQEEVLRKINQLVQNPQLLQIEKELPFVMSLEILRMNNEIQQQIQQKVMNDSDIETMIFQAASIRYQNCSSMDDTYNTRKLIELYSQRSIAEKVDFDFIEHTVNRILLAPSGQVYFEMINGKTI